MSDIGNQPPIPHRRTRTGKSGALRGLVTLALLMVCAGGLVAWGSVGRAQAEDDKNKIDCSDTDLGFNADGYSVECSDTSKSALSIDHNLAGAKVQKLFAIDSSAGVAFLAAIDVSLRGVGVYLRRDSLSDKIDRTFTQLSDEIGSIFKQVEITDWQDTDPVAGFVAAQFTGRFESGARLHCIGFSREVDLAYEGVGREVYGVACSSNSRDQATDALKHLKAPGA